MTRREEIVTATLGCRQSYVDLKRPITPDDVADAFEKGAEWADKTMMTHEEEFENFKELVKRMREAQKQWKDGDPFDGTEMKLAKRMQEAEKEVDEYLEKMEI